MVFLLSVQRAAELNIFIPFVYFNELARFGQFVKYTLFRSPFCPHLVPISAAEGPHLFPISLKIRYPLGPHSEKFRSPFHVGRGEYFSEKSTFLHGPRKWPCKRLQQYLWEQYVTPTVSLFLLPYAIWWQWTGVGCILKSDAYCGSPVYDALLVRHSEFWVTHFYQMHWFRSE